MATFQTLNPASEQILANYERIEPAAIPALVKAAQQAFQDWSQMPLTKRSPYLFKLADKLIERKQRLATTITQEMGKPIRQALAEVEKCAWVCRHFAEHAEQYLADEIIHADYHKSYVTFQPLGMILAIMPWNFPMWQVFRFLAPALMAGNAAIIKPAANTHGSGLQIAELCREIDLPESLVSVVAIDSDAVAQMISQPELVAVTLTGSERAGKAVAMAAGQHLKKVVLELGGNDPYLIFADADIKHAAEHIVKSRMNNTGQVCIAAKRIIVERKIANALRDAIVAEVQQYILGDPLSETTSLGPLARADLRDTVAEQVSQSIASGADCILGGAVEPGTGYFYPATILTNVKPGMPAFDDEIFGPVISLVSVDGESEAIRLANDSRFGLSAAIFTNNVARAEALAKTAVNTGTVYVNSMVASDPRLPFGGIKQSGFGRELAQPGIREFVNIKTIVINHNSG